MTATTTQQNATNQVEVHQFSKSEALSQAANLYFTIKNDDDYDELCWDVVDKIAIKRLLNDWDNVPVPSHKKPADWMTAFNRLSTMYYLTDKDNLMPISYYDSEILAIGRCTTLHGYGLQGLPRAIRQYLCYNSYWDLDFKGSHNTIFEFYCHQYKVKCPAITQYNSNREPILKEVGDQYNAMHSKDANFVPIGRRQVKQTILEIINGGRALYNQLGFRVKFIEMIMKLQEIASFNATKSVLKSVRVSGWS